MKGHFKKRGASWYFWVELERGPDGQRRQKSRGGFKTRKDAERAFAELRDEVRRGAYVEPSKLSLNRYLEEEWLPSIEASIRPTTLRNYRDLYEAYVKPTFGRTQLVNVTPARLNGYYAELLASGRRPGRWWSVSQDSSECALDVAQGAHRRRAVGPSASQPGQSRGTTEAGATRR